MKLFAKRTLVPFPPFICQLLVLVLVLLLQVFSFSDLGQEEKIFRQIIVIDVVLSSSLQPINWEWENLCCRKRRRRRRRKNCLQIGCENWNLQAATTPWSKQTISRGRSAFWLAEPKFSTPDEEVGSSDSRAGGSLSIPDRRRRCYCRKWQKDEEAIDEVFK